MNAMGCASKHMRCVCNPPTSRSRKKGTDRKFYKSDEIRVCIEGNEVNKYSTRLQVNPIVILEVGELFLHSVVIHGQSNIKA